MAKEWQRSILAPASVLLLIESNKALRNKDKIGLNIVVFS
jgi:hypothetical protein